MVKKYFIDSNSVAFKKGFENLLGKRDYMKSYSGRTEYGEYINYHAGIEQARREIKMYGLKRVEEYHRFQVCLSAVGKPESEVRNILRRPDGNVFSDEYNAVLINLHSSSNAFNKGVGDVLFGDKVPSKCNTMDYGDKMSWSNGVDSTRLAVKLHDKEAVISTL